jgi:hypothetical protein
VIKRAPSWRDARRFREALEKGNLERTNQLRDAISEINKGFNDRLSGKATRFIEDYVNNRFRIAIRRHRRGEGDRKWMSLCMDTCQGTDNGTTAVRSDEGEVFLKSCQVGHNKNESVLVDIVELIEMPNQRRIVTSFARVYRIENESLGLGEGLIYCGVRPSGAIGRARFGPICMFAGVELLSIVTTLVFSAMTCLTRFSTWLTSTWTHSILNLERAQASLMG